MTEREVSRQIVGISAAIHFLVDLACIFLATAFLIPLCGDRMDWLWVVMLYNMFAFAFQLPIGALGDRAGVSWKLAAAGCLIIAIAYGIAWAGISASPGQVLPAVIAVVAGIGNSCFHVGCGIAVLERSGRRAAMPGIYVSTGAFGVYLAPLLASRSGPSVWGTAAGILVMLGCALCLARAGRSLSGGGESQTEGNRVREHRCAAGLAAAWMLTAASGLLITVLLRSYAGTIMAFSWKGVPLLGLLFTLGVVLGKMLGGVIGDRIGWMKTALISLLAAAFLFAVTSENPAAGIVAVFVRMLIVDTEKAPHREAPAYYPVESQVCDTHHRALRVDVQFTGRKFIRPELAHHPAPCGIVSRRAVPEFIVQTEGISVQQVRFIHRKGVNV